MKKCRRQLFSQGTKCEKKSGHGTMLSEINSMTCVYIEKSLIQKINIKSLIFLILLRYIYYHISALKHSTEDLVGIIIGECAEFSNFRKYRRLRTTDKSFGKNYEKSMAKIQTQISKKHRELTNELISNSTNEDVRKKLDYAEILLKHWGIYLYSYVLPYDISTLGMTVTS